jgi:hypothetical protein
MKCAWTRGGHRVERVVRRENVRQLRQQKSEVHEVSPASGGRNLPKHALPEKRTPHFAEVDVYRLAPVRHKGNVNGLNGRMG